MVDGHRVDRFEVDSVFDADASQVHVFDVVTPRMTDALLAGVDFSLIVYGACATGKTYTAVGTEQNPGILHQIADYL